LLQDTIVTAGDDLRPFSQVLGGLWICKLDSQAIRLPINSTY
jgi:hypothetical protein